MVGDGNSDVPQETPANTSADTATERLRDEGRQGIGDLSRQQADSNSAANTKIASEFGSLQITGLDQSASSQQKADTATMTAVLGDQPKDNPQQQQKDAADNKDGAGDKKDAAADHKDAPPQKPKTPEEKAHEAADKFEQKGRQELADAHKDLKVTTDGSPPRVFEPQDKFKVTAERKPPDLARDLLGPNATQDQVDLYAKQLSSLNAKFMDSNGDVKFPAGSEIKIPGQTADGGVVTRDMGSTTTQWVDQSQLRVDEEGSGSATFTRPDKSEAVVAWSSEKINYNQETTISPAHDKMSKTLADGTTVESNRITDPRTSETQIKDTKITTTDDKGRTYVQEFDPPGSDKAKKITVTNADKTQVELIPQRNGEYQSADGKTGMTSHGDMFARTVAADGSATRTYDDGSTEKYDARNRMVQKDFKDDFGRQVEYQIKPGENKPETVKITPHPGDQPIELKRHGNNYTADNVDASGKKIGTVQLGKDGRLEYTDDKNKTSHSELKSGATVDITKGADGTKTVVVKGSESFVSETDKKGNLKYDTYTGSDGSKLTTTYKADGKSTESMKIEDKNGGTTELKYDDAAKAFTGQKKDASGKVVENVTMLEGKLVFTDVNTGAVRAEEIEPANADTAIPHMLPGQYDKNTGTFTYENDKHQKVVESFAPGSEDVISADGTIEGSTSRGDKSTVKPDGEVKITHADHTGVRLNADGTIDRWGMNAGENANKEKLSPEEDKYLKGHSDLDKRDLAEIHRRLAGDTTKLDNFYKALETVDTAKNLSDAEKAALRKDIMHHVANPQEIYQGRSPSCNVTVIERDMAMNSPDKYAQTIVGAVSDGKFTTADGTEVPLDTANLKLADASGRDLASRIFQTTTLQAEFYPRREFRNTEDGVGRLYPHPFNAADEPKKFEGLNLPSIADARHRMTGEQEGMTAISNADDLVAAFEANHEKPMIIAVDGSQPPFHGEGPVGRGKVNHVVTVTGIDRYSDPPKVYVDNQWGLKADRSSPSTAIDATTLVRNMKSGGGHGMVLTAGDYNKVYEIKGGKPVENKIASSVIVKAQKALPGEKIM